MIIPLSRLVKRALYTWLSAHLRRGQQHHLDFSGDLNSDSVPDKPYLSGSGVATGKNARYSRTKINDDQKSDLRSGSRCLISAFEALICLQIRFRCQ